MATDLERAFKALRGKKGRHNTLWRYYDGEHPLVYSAERLRKLFRHVDAHFTENWCSVIVDSVMDRLNLARFIVGDDESATKLLNQMWQRAEMDLDSDDAHLDALVTGEAYVLVWPGVDGELEAYYNDARLCHVEYEAERPRVARWAAKWWKREDGTHRLTLYYVDHLEYYRTTNKRVPRSWKAFVPLAGEAARAVNPFGRIPVFHLRSKGRGDGELTRSIVELQNAVNKLLADMMVAAEFGAFKQRYVISNAEIGDLKNAPNIIWDLPAGDGIGQDTEAGEFAAAQLGNFLGAIDHLSVAMSIISRTPKHYFSKLPTHEISGEALLALEAPLNKKCSRYIERFVVTWRKVAVFMLELAGVSVDALAVRPVFDRPETIQPRTQAEIRQINATARIPLATTLRDEGKDELYMAQLRRDRQEEELASADLARAYLGQARRELSQEEGAPPGRGLERRRGGDDGR